MNVKQLISFLQDIPGDATVVTLDLLGNNEFVELDFVDVGLDVGHKNSNGKWVLDGAAGTYVLVVG